MFTTRHVVDNRVFLLALDNLYRDAMKRQERAELLSCARQVASALTIAPANLPVEGYYADEEQLTEYFRLMRTLQQVDERRRPEVGDLPAFRRLEQVTSAPIYGHPRHEGKLLPVGRDALSQALLDTRPHWTIAGVTAAALMAAQEADDISLVGLAARIQDAVVLTALRESVVLYTEGMVWIEVPPEPQVVWQVDDDLAQCAGRFVDAFNALFGERLPAPTPEEAIHYWHAYERVKIVGRCVRLGVDDTHLPIRHYHWAICRGSNGQLTVHEFWHREIWTTARYRAGLPVNDDPHVRVDPA